MQKKWTVFGFNIGIVWNLFSVQLNANISIGNSVFFSLKKIVRNLRCTVSEFVYTHKTHRKLTYVARKHNPFRTDIDNIYIYKYTLKRVVCLVFNCIWLSRTLSIDPDKLRNMFVYLIRSIHTNTNEHFLTRLNYVSQRRRYTHFSLLLIS